MTGSDEEPPSRRNAVIALAVVAKGLVVLGWWLSDILAAASRVQDCVMAGRRNCVIFR